MPKAQKKSALVIPTAKFEFKTEPFGLAQTPIHFQQLTNEVLKGFLFAFGYLDDIFIYSKDIKNSLNIYELYLIDYEQPT